MSTNEIKNKSELLAELKTMRDEAQQLVEKLDEKISKYEAEIDNDDEAAYNELRKFRR